MNAKSDTELDYYARTTVTELRRQLAAQSRYITELEKQLEYANPGIVKEVREFLEARDQS